jgi:hypothetical protein
MRAGVLSTGDSITIGGMVVRVSVINGGLDLEGFIV